MKLKMGRLVLLLLLVQACSVLASHSRFLFDQENIPHGHDRQRRSVRDCSDPNNPITEPTATDTTQRLTDLRREMTKNNFSAYTVPSSDAHLSEYLAKNEKRRAWITGFTGSAGTAVITETKAALWTDGRYFQQAEQQLDCNWILMKMGEIGVPTVEEWIIGELASGTHAGANPFLFSIESWQAMEQNLAKGGIAMVESIPDLIDVIWSDRPPASGTEVIVFPVQYAGVKWQDKLANARIEMIDQNADYLLVTVLDEIAWFFNLRGNDIPYTPVFTSYAIISRTAEIYLFANPSFFGADDVVAHLNETGCKSKSTCVYVRPYDDARPVLSDLASSDAQSKFWLPEDGTNYGMYSAVDPVRQISDTSPFKVAKAVKNEVEVQAMRDAHIYDAVALCEYLQWLEVNVPLNTVDELIGEEKLKNLRQAQPASRGLSFGSISASGPNGAIIHYGSSEETNRNLTLDEMYLIDSGGQYFEGTTDVTRTMHFGNPSAFEIEAFTRVLMGQINVQRAIFPYTKDGNDLDILAREPLYEIGLEYRHGTGHGVGQYLSIHEYPPGIGNILGEGYPLQPGMITSVEPGYYEEEHFGIRHENLCVVVNATTEHQFGGYEFYTFEPITLVPYQQKMIDVSLLSDVQLEYVNKYHQKVLDVVGQEALKQGKPELQAWLQSSTLPLARSSGNSVASTKIFIFTFNFASVWMFLK